MRRRRLNQHKRHTGAFFIVLLVLVVIAYGYASYRMPLPALAAQSSLETANYALTTDMAWPKYGASAIGAVGYGVLASNGNNKQIPTASVAKTMAALAVLHQRPLTLGDQGPTLTLTQTDVGYFDKYFAEGGSLVKVAVGEKITEYQALEAMMLPSANNMAETLAVWAFGSEANYVQFANSYAKQLGMTNSHFTDASGFNPKTVSTAHDLVLLGIAAERNPVLAQVVSHKTAKLPVAGTVSNVNWLLNYEHFNGIKTGSTDQDGGAILFSEPKTYPNGQTVTIVGVIMGAKFLSQALNDAFPLVHAAEKNFKSTTVVTEGQVVGHYDVPWGEKIDVAATKTITLLAWQGQKIIPKISFKQLQAPTAKGTVVGTITTTANPKLAVPLVTKQAAIEPNWYWRTLRKL